MPHSNILLPSWHLEDVSRDLNEQEAAAILNAYAVAVHPWMVALCRAVPHWTAAPSPGEIDRDRVVILPEPSRKNLPTGWLAQAEETGVIVLNVTADREETLQTMRSHPRLRELLLEQLQEAGVGEVSLDAAPAQEDLFSALGTVYLLTLLLSQAMYHYDNIDETQFCEELIAAAEAAIRQQGDETETKMASALEQLLESREKFYPVEAHLIDLCLLNGPAKAEDIDAVLQADHTVNLLCSGEQAAELAAQDPEAIARLKAGIEQEQVAILGGEYEDVATPLLPLQTLRYQLEKGRAAYLEHLGVQPGVWMRMRFGLSTQLPLMLQKVGINNAYHLVLDDGMYPDEEQSHYAWEGRSSNIVQTISRIPLSVENASSLLKVPERMADAMNHDHLACVVLARWPQLKQPWFEDLTRIQKISPILGHFSRLDSFLQDTEDSGHQVNNDQRHYQSPYFDQWVGQRRKDTLSRVADFWTLQEAHNTLSWLENTKALLSGQSADESVASRERTVQELAVELKREAIGNCEEQTRQQMEQAAAGLVEKITARGTDQDCAIILNPLSHPRTAVVSFPLTGPAGERRVPKIGAAVKHVQIDSDQVHASVQLPACGFAAIDFQPADSFRPPRVKAPLAGELFLQNEFFHVQIDPKTGGIQRLRVHGSNETLLSQRLVYRLDGDIGTVPRGGANWPQSSFEPRYSVMVADSVELVSTGPVQGAIRTRGRLIDPSSERVVAEFEQRFVVARGVRSLQVEMDIQPRTDLAVRIDRSYLAARFAWASSAARVSATLQQSQFVVGEQRIESTGPVEVDDGDHRITLEPHFLPLHHRTAQRMLDSVLVVQGESQRSFRYDIAVDAPHPATVSAEANTPPLVVPSKKRPAADAAWLYHLSAPSVQLAGVGPVSFPESIPLKEEEQGRPLFQFDFLETEGQHAVTRLGLVRRLRKAWEVDFTGKVLSELEIQDDQIVFECLPCDYLRVVAMC